MGSACVCPWNLPALGSELLPLLLFWLSCHSRLYLPCCYMRLSQGSHSWLFKREEGCTHRTLARRQRQAHCCTAPTHPNNSSHVAWYQARKRRMYGTGKALEILTGTPGCAQTPRTTKPRNRSAHTHHQHHHRWPKHPAPQTAAHNLRYLYRFISLSGHSNGTGEFFITSPSHFYPMSPDWVKGQQ